MNVSNQILVLSSAVKTTTSLVNLNYRNILGLSIGLRPSLGYNNNRTQEPTTQPHNKHSDRCPHAKQHTTNDKTTQCCCGDRGLCWTVHYLCRRPCRGPYRCPRIGLWISSRPNLPLRGSVQMTNELARNSRTISCTGLHWLLVGHVLQKVWSSSYFLHNPFPVTMLAPAIALTSTGGLTPCCP